MRALERSLASGARCSVAGAVGEPPVCECGAPAVVSYGHGPSGLECSATGTLISGGDAVFQGEVPEDQRPQGGPGKAPEGEPRLAFRSKPG